MIDPLKPCPFCGGEATQATTREGEHLVQCKDCASHTAIDYGDPIDAAAAWNTRASFAQADGLLAILHDDRLLEAIARGYDVEDAAQRGEPDPWSVDRVTLNTEERQIAEMWEQERIECARQGIMLAIAAMEDDE